MIQGYKLIEYSQAKAFFDSGYVESLPDTASRATTTEPDNPTPKSKTAVFRAMPPSSTPQRPSRSSKGAPSSQSSTSSTTAPAASARPLFPNLGRPRPAITSDQSASKCLALMTAYLLIGSRSGSLRTKRDIIFQNAQTTYSPTSTSSEVYRYYIYFYARPRVSTRKAPLNISEWFDTLGNSK